MSVSASELASAPIGSAISAANAAAATAIVRSARARRAVPEPCGEADEQRRQREHQPALDEPVGVTGGEEPDLERRPPARA